MRLIDLEPEWINATSDKAFYRFSDSHSHVTYFAHHDPEQSEELAQAHGICFLCPVCFKKNGGAVGTEHVLIWFAARPVPADYEPKPRWQVAGTSFEDLTISPSINVGPEHWHGWIRNGEVT